jgi:hypothetical protein
VYDIDEDHHYLMHIILKPKKEIIKIYYWKNKKHIVYLLELYNQV